VNVNAVINSAVLPLYLHDFYNTFLNRHKFYL